MNTVQRPLVPLTAKQSALVRRGYYLIAYAIREFGHRFPALDGDELFSAGQWGLVKAAQGYDASKAKWSTYAVKCIYRHIQRDASQRSLVRVPMHLQSRKKAGHKYQTFARPAWCVRGSGTGARIDLANDDRDDAEPTIDLHKLDQAVAALPPRTRLVVEACVRDGKTLQEIGQRLDVCKERVRQIRNQGIAMLRQAVREDQET